jgi:hypothetical protein
VKHEKFLGFLGFSVAGVVVVIRWWLGLAGVVFWVFWGFLLPAWWWLFGGGLGLPAWSFGFFGVFCCRRGGGYSGVLGLAGVVFWVFC